MCEEKGLIHLYCGDGKGKTTAAAGMALRFAGHGLPVIFAQFQKNLPSGEITTLEALPAVTVLRVQDGLTAFPWEFTEEERALRCASHNALLQNAVALCAEGERRLLVLDEIVGALNDGLIDREAVWRFLQNKPHGTELILTGRNPEEELCRLADYITCMEEVKHPMRRGIPSRKGVEY